MKWVKGEKRHDGGLRVRVRDRATHMQCDEHDEKPERGMETTLEPDRVEIHAEVNRGEI